MPIYEFKCEKCEKITEELTEMNVGNIDCQCGSIAHRIISNGVRTIYNSRGFYCTDNVKRWKK